MNRTFSPKLGIGRTTYFLSSTTKALHELSKRHTSDENNKSSDQICRGCSGLFIMSNVLFLILNKGESRYCTIKNNTDETPKPHAVFVLVAGPRLWHISLKRRRLCQLMKPTEGTNLQNRLPDSITRSAGVCGCTNGFARSVTPVVALNWVPWCLSRVLRT